MADVELHRQNISSVMATAAGRWGERVGRQIANAAKARCPVDDGRLRSSITHLVTARPGGGVIVQVGSPLAYARWRHEGTGIYGPHRTPIVPVTAKALKFKGSGRVIGPLRPGQSRPSKSNRGGFIFRTSVKGSPGSPFLADALEEVFGPSITRNPTNP